MLNKSDDVKLPDDILRLNYVEATGNSQYLITDYIPQLDKPSKIIADFQFTAKRASGTGRIFGKANGSTNFGTFGFGLDGTNDKWFFMRSYGKDGQASSGVRFGTPDLERHTFVFEYQKGVSIDGVLYEETIEQSSYYNWRGNTTKGNEFALFASQRGGQIYDTSYASAKIYSFKLYEGENPLKNA